MNEICPCLLAEYFFSGSVFKVYEIVWVSGISCSCFFFFCFCDMHGQLHTQHMLKTMPERNALLWSGKMKSLLSAACHHSSQMCPWGTRPLLRMVSSFKKEHVCMCMYYPYISRLKLFIIIYTQQSDVLSSLVWCHSSSDVYWRNFGGDTRMDQTVPGAKQNISLGSGSF